MKRILLAMTILFLAGCGFTETSDVDGKVLDVELPLKPASIAPYESFIPYQMGATETLFIVEDGKLEPNLVEDYKQVSEDTLELTIRDDIKFQNNHKLTGEAVKNSIEQSRKESSLLKGSIPIESIEVDGQKMTIKTSKPTPNLANELANPFIAIFDTESKTNEDEIPIGTGPFEVTDYQRTKKVTLQKFEDYWQGEPKLDGIVLEFHEDGDMRVDHLLDGNSDVTTDVPIERIPDVDNNKNTEVDIAHGFRVSHIIYNFESDKMVQPVREALDKVINRKAIVDKIFNGYAAETNAPFSDMKTDIEYNPEEAKSLMEAEGYSKDNPLTITVATYDGRPELTKMLEVIQSDAKEAYFDIQIKNVDDIEAFLEDRDNFDATMYNFLTEPRGDKSYYFEMSFLPDGPTNKGGYNNKKVTELIHDLQTTVDKNKQASIEEEILDIIFKDQVNSYIARTDNVVAFRENVKGIKATPEGIKLIDYQVDIDD